MCVIVEVLKEQWYETWQPREVARVGRVATGAGRWGNAAAARYATLVPAGSSGSRPIPSPGGTSPRGSGVLVFRQDFTFPKASFHHIYRPYSATFALQQAKIIALLITAGVPLFSIKILDFTFQDKDL